MLRKASRYMLPHLVRRMQDKFVRKIAPKMCGSSSIIERHGQFKIK